MLYRWDRKAGSWQSISLREGEPFRLGAALFLPRPKGRHYLLVREGARVAVNGLPSLPLRVLADRDAVRISEEMVYFSAGTSATHLVIVIAPFTVLHSLA